MMTDKASSSIRDASTAASVLKIPSQQLVLDYQKNEVAADAKYRNRTVELTGLLSDIRKDALDRIYVTLDSGESWKQVHCTFRDEQSPLVAQLEKRQLVAVRGEVRGMVMNSPILEKCTVTWMGPKSELSQSNRETASLVAASSLDLCAPTIVLEQLGKHPDGNPQANSVEQLLLDGLARKHDGGTPTAAEFRQVKDMSNQFNRMLKRARANLDRIGVQAMPCDHPLLLVAWRCQVNAADSSPECGSPFVKAVIAKQAH